MRARTDFLVKFFKFHENDECCHWVFPAHGPTYDVDLPIYRVQRGFERGRTGLRAGLRGFHNESGAVDTDFDEFHAGTQHQRKADHSCRAQDRLDDNTDPGA